MEGAQRDARAGCNGPPDNLLIDRTVALDCNRRRRNLSVAWIDVKKAYDSVDHNWLNGVMTLHRFPTWLCKVIAKLCKSWNTKVVVITREGKKTSERIKFNKGLPQGDALCPRLFNVCLNPVAWTTRAAEGYRMSKPINSNVTGLPYIDDFKIFAASASKLERVMKMVKSSMEDVGLQWNPRKCAVAHVKRRVQGCFWWLTEWKNCPSHTIAGLVELYEPLLPTRVYTSQKTHTSAEGDVRCRLCGNAPQRAWLISCQDVVRWRFTSCCAMREL